MNLLRMHRKFISSCKVQLTTLTAHFSTMFAFSREVRYVLMREPRAKNESDLLGESEKHEKKVHCSDGAWEIWP